MSAAWMLALALNAAAPPLLEAELRWVEQAAPPLGSLTSRAAPAGALRSASAEVLPLPLLRLQAGGGAEWELELPAGAEWLQGGAASWRVRVAAAASPRWQLRLQTHWQGADRPLRVELEWRQPLPEGGSQRWASQLTLRTGHWTVLARSAPPPPAAGSLSTQSLQPIRELQLRLRSLNP